MLEISPEASSKIAKANAAMAKQQAMAKSAFNTAIAISQISKDLPGSNGKRIFPKRDKSKGKKKRTAIVIAKVMFAVRMGYAQILTIASQPIPNYIPGGEHDGGLATIDETGIVTLNIRYKDPEDKGESK